MVISSLVLERGRKCFFFNLNFIDYWCLCAVHAHICAMVHVRISKGNFQESSVSLGHRLPPADAEPSLLPRRYQSFHRKALENFATTLSSCFGFYVFSLHGLLSHYYVD